jgi:hypothetical protein
MARRIEIGGTTKRAIVLSIAALCVLGTGAIVVAGRHGDDDVFRQARRIGLERSTERQARRFDDGRLREVPPGFGGQPFRGHDHDGRDDDAGRHDGRRGDSS